MSKKVSNMLISALLMCSVVLLTGISYMNMDAMRQFSGVSLRYNEPISGQEAYRLRRYSIERSDENVFWPAFWHEFPTQIESEYRTIYAPCILYSGDAALIFPAKYIAGAAPGVTDGVGSAISSGLAHELWGGHDVVGKSLVVDGSERIVRGVFELEQPLAMISFEDEDTRQRFSGIELSGGVSSPDRKTVTDFISAAGLEEPDVILLAGPTFLATVMFLVPLMVIALYAIVIGIIRIHKRPVVLYTIVFSILLCLALTLPTLLEALPSRMIPSRLSDFSFWETQLRQLEHDLHEYLRLSSSTRDIEYAGLFFRQIGLSFLSAITALTACCGCHFRTRKYSLNSNEIRNLAAPNA